MESLNIVELLEKSPMTKLSNTYQSKLLTKIKERFTEDEQQMFVTSFYCYLNCNATDFVIDLDNIWRWVGFQQKVKAKILLEKHFKLDIDYKFLLSHMGKQDKSHGGNNKEIFMLTVKTFKMFCLKAGTEKADKIHEYYINLEETLHEVIEEESDELRKQLETQKQNHEIELKTILTDSEEQLQNQKDENEQIRLENGKVPTIYIWNTDSKSSELLPSLKIGMTATIHTRFKPYKLTNPNGKCIFQKEISGEINLRKLETHIHSKLKKFHFSGEIYKMDSEEAKICILTTIYNMELYQIGNDRERQLKVKKIFDATHNIFNDITLSTSDISTQTEFNEDVPLSQPIIERDNSLQNKFDEFIESHCIMRSDVEVSSKQIVGAYRLYAREAKREVTQAFTDYLNRKFKPDRLKVQNMDQIVMGFSGVMLKPVKYEKQLNLTDHENFIFNNFEFTPDGTVLWSTIVNEFKNWKRLMKEGYSDIEENLLKKYLKQSQYLLFETVWASGGSGQGYYGLKSKSEINQHRTSSTACKIQKKDINNNVLCEFETIAKIASIEKISPATMSRSIKNKVIFEGIGGSYFYAKKSN